jgi:uncharacterized protein YerC
MLQEGKSWRHIQATTKASMSTISRLAKRIKEEGVAA